MGSLQTQEFTGPAPSRSKRGAGTDPGRPAESLCRESLEAPTSFPIPRSQADALSSPRRMPGTAWQDHRARTPTEVGARIAGGAQRDSPAGGAARETADEAETWELLPTSRECGGRKKAHTGQKLFEGRRGGDAAAASRREPGPNRLVAPCMALGLWCLGFLDLPLSRRGGRRKGGQGEREQEDSAPHANDKIGF